MPLARPFVEIKMEGKGSYQWENTLVGARRREAEHFTRLCIVIGHVFMSDNALLFLSQVDQTTER